MDNNKSKFQIMVDMYEEGKSLNEIARAFDTYATSVSRTLKEAGVELRHDTMKKGEYYVKGGKDLIEWAKAQGRYVTKTELAHVLGKERLSPSYFKKYPELNNYIRGGGQKEFREDIERLYKFLADNDIPYKPNDKTALKVTVTALLEGEYSNIAIQITDKGHNVSMPRYRYEMEEKKARAAKAGICLILISIKDLDDLDGLKHMIDTVKFKST